MKSPESQSEFESKEKPPFLYHGTSSVSIENLEPRKNYTPKGLDVPKAVYATDLPAFAAAHSFPWGSDEGFALSVEDGKVIFEVPEKFRQRLLQKVYLYKLPSNNFNWTKEDTTGHTLNSPENVVPADVQEFNTEQEVIEFFGGEIIYSTTT